MDTIRDYFHSVTLDESQCLGCTNCIKNCPTEAIRVRKGKAVIITERCIDCGECIRVCPHHAKMAVSDELATIRGFDRTVALPAPSLYGQFGDLSPDAVLSALLELGFDEVFEVALAADTVSRLTADLLAEGAIPKPVISSSCPAVVRLIQVRFPGLLEHLLTAESPMETAARTVKARAENPESTGVFFITPCPAKVTAVRAPLGSDRSAVDGVISVKEIHLLLNETAKKVTLPSIRRTSSAEGIAWARSSGEAESSGTRNTVVVDGIHRVIEILEEVENGSLGTVDFIEAMACPGGCVGGALNPENPYIARSRIRDRTAEAELQPAENGVGPSRAAADPPSAVELRWTGQPEPRHILRMLDRIEEISEVLPGLDCGSCGAPSCRALAEDIVRGGADKTDCIFVLRNEIRHLTLEMVRLEEKLPPSLDRGETPEKGDEPG
jgi:iron only hydrogenase large subunit-like protein